jgi:hypothetical protein
MADDVTKRVRYFDHQFLRLAEFQTEQAYHLDRRRRLSRGLHSPGVVEGLEVSQSGPLEVGIAPGWAIDGLGREVILTAATTAAIPATDGNAEVYLVYAEEPTDPSQDPGTEGLHTRFTEQPAVVVGPAPADGILLATAAVSGGAIADVTDRRIIAGVDADNLVDGSVTTRKLADGAVTTPKIDGGAVTGPKLATNAVTTPSIMNGAVTEPKIADGAIGPTKIQDGAIGMEKLDRAVIVGLVSSYGVYDGVNDRLLNAHNMATAGRSGVGEYEFRWSRPLHESGPVFVYAYGPTDGAPGVATAFVTRIGPDGVAISVVDRNHTAVDAIVNVMAFGVTGEQPLGPLPEFLEAPNPVFDPNSVAPGEDVTILGQNFVEGDTSVVLVPQAGADVRVEVLPGMTVEKLPVRLRGDVPAGTYRARVSTPAGSAVSPADRRLEVTS